MNRKKIIVIIIVGICTLLFLIAANIYLDKQTPKLPVNNSLKQQILLSTGTPVNLASHISGGDSKYSGYGFNGVLTDVVRTEDALKQKDGEVLATVLIYLEVVYLTPEKSLLTAKIPYVVKFADGTIYFFEFITESAEKSMEGRFSVLKEKVGKPVYSLIFSDFQKAKDDLYGNNNLSKSSVDGALKLLDVSSRYNKSWSDEIKSFVFTGNSKTMPYLLVNSYLSESFTGPTFTLFK